MLDGIYGAQKRLHWEITSFLVEKLVLQLKRHRPTRVTHNFETT